VIILLRVIEADPGSETVPFGCEWPVEAFLRPGRRVPAGEAAEDGAGHQARALA